MSEDLIGRIYFISQAYIQWLIDSGRKNLGKSVLLKGAGMIFPKNSLEDIIDILEKGNDGYLGQFTNLVEDTKLSLELRERDYNIKFIDGTYTIEDSPGSLKVAFKRFKRWFKGNFCDTLEV
ncbi:glycosyltransferase family 2 protein [Pyrococcus kukulkanii]|uniref:glycosyltransferase family 2 protein n=1 Tax=Pyrococcus kukulkanii TaxID=1609559 RepID=UPI0035675115